MNSRELSRGAEEIYSSTPLDEIPWNSVEPPELLVELVEGGKVRTGRALDLGCGLGNYAIWLASHGLDVVGVDASPTAIKIAKQNAKRKKVKCKFLVADITEPLPESVGQFDFVYDWGVLHHIFPEKRGKYVENVHRMLKPTGKYVSVCFNEKDTAFARLGEGAAQTQKGIYTSNTSLATERIETPSRSREGSGKYRKTNMGTIVYLSSQEELQELFGRFFRIVDFRVFESAGKFMTHVFNYCFMELKGN